MSPNGVIHSDSSARPSAKRPRARPGRRKDRAAGFSDRGSRKGGRGAGRREGGKAGRPHDAPGARAGKAQYMVGEPANRRRRFCATDEDGAALAEVRVARRSETMRVTEIMRVINVIAEILLIVGGLNWGLIGLFDLNVVAAIFGAGPVVTTILYILVGLASLRGIYLLKPVSVLVPAPPAGPPPHNGRGPTR